MQLLSRIYQIDYMFGLRYLYSPTFRAQVRTMCGGSPWLSLMYTFGGALSVIVTITAMLLAAIAILDLINE